LILFSNICICSEGTKLAGCATGEECYTLVMYFNHFKEETASAGSVRILGTDITEEVLKKAEKGVYP